MSPLAPTNWPAWCVLLPLAFGVACAALPRGRPAIGLLGILATLGTSVATMTFVVRHGSLTHSAAGWSPPLGIALHVDGFAALMLGLSGVVSTAVGWYAWSYWRGQAVEPEGRTMTGFWPLLLFLLAALNALYVSADLFNVYVALELTTLAAVALIALERQGEARTGALEYLLVSLFASLAYLLGVGMLYARGGTLAFAELRAALPAELLTSLALALIVGGLLIKTALFPFHFWLPGAHASAPTPVSAVLSALVVKGPFYLMLRYWFDVFPHLFAPAAGTALGILGSAAIFWGGLQAMRQHRLKLIVAYSTVAQLGYLFLAFPIAAMAPGSAARNGAVYFMVAHALGKAAMFLTAGNIIAAAGHDRIREMHGVSRLAPASALTFALAGVSLMGLPPSGGFIGKWLLITSALAVGQWWWAVVIVAGSLIAASYLYPVVALSLRTLDEPRAEVTRLIPMTAREWSPLVLALGATALGFLAPQLLALIAH